jgi:hypothetical protein
MIIVKQIFYSCYSIIFLMLLSSLYRYYHLFVVTIIIRWFYYHRSFALLLSSLPHQLAIITGVKLMMVTIVTTIPRWRREKPVRSILLIISLCVEFFWCYYHPCIVTIIFSSLLSSSDDFTIIVHLRYYCPRCFFNVDFLSIKAVCKIKQRMTVFVASVDLFKIDDLIVKVEK